MNSKFTKFFSPNKVLHYFLFSFSDLDTNLDAHEYETKQEDVDEIALSDDHSEPEADE